MIHILQYRPLVPPTVYLSAMSYTQAPWCTYHHHRTLAVCIAHWSR
jgi:hypothetical protein